MTGAENERLAKVETLLGVAASDVAEVKADVKTLQASVISLKEIVDRRAGFGDAFRSSIPFLALGVAIASMLVR